MEIDDYAEVPELLHQVERRVAARRIWVSGSWPIESGGSATAAIYSLSEAIGRWAGQSGRALVSGIGLLVGSAVISGFLDALRDRGGWDLDRRLIARPFPQALDGAAPNAAKLTELRKEMARQAGAVIFVGGAKLEGNAIVTANGVMEEFEIALQTGVFLLPIGSSGGAALEITNKLIGSAIPNAGSGALRPTDDELRLLADVTTVRDDVLKCLDEIVERLNVVYA